MERSPDEPLLRDGAVAAAAREVAATLRAAGFQALFAGGAVRDALLGRTPADIDIATSARPGRVEALFPRTHAVGRAYGVVVVRHRGIAFEVATFRAESGYSDGRHPDAVTYADVAADAGRRDFTINGLFYDPAEERLLDLVGGVADLDARVIRSIGDAARRLEEDRLRAMRAVRFAAGLGFDVAPATWEAVCAAAPTVGAVSTERLRDELLGMLVGPAPDRAMQMLADSGLLAVVLPEALAMIGCTQPPAFHPEGDVWTHTLLMLRLMARRAGEGGAPAPPELALAVLLHDIGKPPTRVEADRIRFHGHDALGAQMAGTILRRLRCSRETIHRVCALVGHHMRFIALRQMRPARRTRWLRDPLFPLHLELHALDCLGSHGDLAGHAYAVEALAALPPEPGPRLITGRDLLDLGLPQGPAIGALLEAIEDRIAAGEITTRRDALAHAAAAVAAGGDDGP